MHWIWWWVQNILEGPRSHNIYWDIYCCCIWSRVCSGIQKNLPYWPAATQNCLSSALESSIRKSLLEVPCNQEINDHGLLIFCYSHDLFSCTLSITGQHYIPWRWFSSFDCGSICAILYPFWTATLYNWNFEIRTIKNVSGRKKRSLASVRLFGMNSSIWKYIRLTIRSLSDL